MKIAIPELPEYKEKLVIVLPKIKKRLLRVHFNKVAGFLSGTSTKKLLKINRFFLKILPMLFNFREHLVKAASVRRKRCNCNHINLPRMLVFGGV